MIQDLRCAVRLLLRAKGFALIAILTLGLGIGAATAIFSIVNGALLRPLPYRQPERLIEILDRSLHERGMNRLFATYGDAREYARHARTLESVAAVTWAVKSPILTGRGTARTVLAIPVSAAFFEVLGARAALGRTFATADEDGGCVVVLAHAFWESALGGAQNAVGQTLDLDDKSCSILGVMPKGFAFYPAAAQLWTLILPGEPNADKMLAIAVGRMKAGVRREQVETELTALSAAIHTDDAWRDFGPIIESLQDGFTWFAGRNLGATLWILLAAVGMVLLLACVNVSNLLLGRSLARTREFAVRAALGGGRARLFRQLVIEAMPLAALAGAAGVGIAWATVHYFRAVNPVELPVGSDISLDWRVLLFSFGVSALAALIAAAAPGWKASRTDINAALKNAARGLAGGRHGAARTLTALEVALSFVLLAGAGLLIESVLRMSSADLGFRPEGVIAGHITLPAERYQDPAARWRFYEALERSMANQPGIASAAVSSILPPDSGGTNTLEIFGGTADSRHLPHDVLIQLVTPDYFATTGARVLSGGFSQKTEAQHAPEAVVNQALAAEVFPERRRDGSTHPRGRRESSLAQDRRNCRNRAPHHRLQRDAMGGAAGGLPAAG